jgi:hypothetical protein
VVALGSAALFFALLAITSNMVVLSVWELNPFVDPAHILMEGLIALLFGANIGVLLHNSDRSNAMNGETQMTTLGGLAALLTSSCPLCQPVFMLALGLGGLGALFASLSFVMVIVSVVLLLISLERGLEAADGTCRLRRR